MRFLLAAAAAPSLALSLWLLHVVDAPRTAMVQQCIAIVAGACLLAVAPRRWSDRGGMQWVVPLASSLWIPLALASSVGPTRWVALGGVRVYVASIVVPLIVYWLGAASQRPVGAHTVAVAVVAVALVLQPDAAQLTAFTAALLVSLALARTHRGRGASIGAALLACVAVAWQRPDPLAPVPWVEGVFHVAASSSPIALVAVLVGAAATVIAFAWIARSTSSRGAHAVAVYYATLFSLAPLQVTPVPLLGFGAGPVLGYFLVAAAVSGENADG